MSLQLVPCPLCGLGDAFVDVAVPDADVHIQKYGSLYEGATKSQWKICEHCGFVHQNPRPSTEALNQFYAQSQYHAELTPANAAARLSFGRWYFGEKIDFALKHGAPGPGAVFDIGCGQGEVLSIFEERGWRAYGIEPDPVLANYAISEFGLRGVRQGVLDQRFEPDEPVDLVFTNHAFEHFGDLDAIMRGVLTLLKPGGHLMIVVPTYMKNRSSLSKLWMNSAHYSLFTHHSLNNLLSRYGFEEVAHTYRGWRKEVDDLWFLTKLSDRRGDPQAHFEDPRRVSRYLRIVNPTRSFLFYPIYSNWTVRVSFYYQVTRALKLLVTSPATFLSKALSRVKRAARSL